MKRSVSVRSDRNIWDYFRTVSEVVHFDRSDRSNQNLPFQFNKLARVPKSAKLCLHCAKFEVDKHQLATSIKKRTSTCV